MIERMNLGQNSFFMVLVLFLFCGLYVTDRNEMKKTNIPQFHLLSYFMKLWNFFEVIVSFIKPAYLTYYPLL